MTDSDFGAVSEDATGAVSDGTDLNRVHAEIARLDAEILDAVNRRLVLAQLAARTRVESGAPMVALGGETDVIRRYQDELGPRGSLLALELLRLARPPFSSTYRTR
ncbi:chorismate mutase [Rhodococcus sp. ACS1]|uniref:chorismate mutase n=1 Tax=Rhodococcus TaxID=1827 RepID=UPI000BB0FF15|nr:MULTISPECIES: chorismate mutase [unclassified Rhodococcus (in: high G+C Gram-positive bacteria)]MDF3307120.1 chorismate mutase [Rhodococcus sp. T2V]PBC39809.1 chorismate mutase [Rhodococcus sp. ACS1]